MDDRNLYGAPARRGRGGIALLLLIVFLGGIAVTAFAVHRWDRLAGLLHPVTATPAARPVAVAPLPAAPAPVAGTDPALTEKVEALDDRIDVLNTKAQEASSAADRAEGLLVAFAARRAIDRGQPLGYLEGLLQKHFAADNAQAVAMIVGAAQKPVTLLQLQNQFAKIAPTLVTPGPSEGWWTGVQRELGSLFVVRKVQTPSSEPADQRDRALRALDQGAVDDAMAEVLRMPGASRANAWVAEARRYVLAHNALDRIEAAALLQRAEPVAVTAQ